MAKENEDKVTAPFTLKSGGSGFEGRSNNIFAGLDELEQEHIRHEENRTDIEEYADLNPVDGEVDSVTNERHSHRNRSDGATQNRKRNYNEDKDPSHGHGDRNMSRNRDRHQQSPDTQFRVPRGRAPGRNPGRRNRSPDHGNRPDNWTYYCLEDVRNSEMSERSNTQAALAFLDERRKLREQQEQREGGGEEHNFDASSAACSKGLFSFAKRNKSGPTDSKSVDTDKPAAGDAELPVSGPEDLETEIPDDSSEAELGTDGEEQEPASKESSASSSGDSTAPDATKPSFKSRKGIKRSIRLREEDD